MAAAPRPRLITPVNETEHSFSRVSQEGKRITYNLKVIQQPERARACGAGAKSSADRRPVDPPPVVELRVYESDLDNDMSKTDITFAYNANFFLFATLENARPIAPGRVSGQAPNPPVLTGVPVAGIAYLDRPAQAGYFIFPDLSVRHEGNYRLSFNLYEEVKDPKDADKEPTLLTPPAQSPPSGKPSAPKSFLNFRLEVKSAPFQVYSAKKFPGLATSTSLSRVVAEQGCRVRIRRDVRMRRRGEKSNKDYGDYEEDRGYGRSSSRYTTPTPIERPRSTSTASSAPVDPLAYAYPQTPRRDSVSHEYSAFKAHHAIPPPPAPSTPYQHPHPHANAHPAPPPPPAAAAAAPLAAPGYLSFGSTPTSYQTPQMPAAPPPPPHHVYTPGSTTPKSYSSHASLPHSRNPSNSSENESIPQSYPSRSNHLPSILNPAPVEPETYHSATTTPTSAQSSQPPRTHTPSSSIMLPPISSFASSVPPPPSTSDKMHQRRPSYYPIDSTLSKRSHEDSFGSYDAIAQNKSVRSTENDYAGVNNTLNGSNINSGSNSSTGALSKRGPIEVDGPQWEPPQMEYRRADGRMSSKIQRAV